MNNLPDYSEYKNMSDADRRNLYTRPERQRKAVAAELEARKPKLSETEALLEQARTRLNALKQQGIQNTSVYEKQISDLEIRVKEENARLEARTSPSGKFVTNALAQYREKLLTFANDPSIIEAHDVAVMVFWETQTGEPDVNSDEFATAIQPFVNAKVQHQQALESQSAELQRQADNAAAKATELRGQANALTDTTDGGEANG